MLAAKLSERMKRVNVGCLRPYPTLLLLGGVATVVVLIILALDLVWVSPSEERKAIYSASKEKCRKNTKLEFMAG